MLHRKTVINIFMLDCTRLTASCIMLLFAASARLTEEMLSLSSSPTIHTSGLLEQFLSAEACNEIY